jgi:hypothetical protein
VAVLDRICFSGMMDDDADMLSGLAGVRVALTTISSRSMTSDPLP